MNLQEVKELFEISLLPIKDDISDLKRGQNELIEIIKVQTRQEAEIENIKEKVDDCKNNVTKMKETGNNRIWEVCKLGIAGIVGGVIAKIF